MVMKYKGMISTTTTVMTSADMHTAAERIAALPGIADVTVTELKRYSEASQFEVQVACQKAFSYLYAMGTGDESVLSAQERQAFDIAKDVAGQAEEYATDFEKEVFFHDYLVLNIAYDISDSMGTGQTPYGALVLGKCVCAGYASAMQVLLTLAGIECMEVSGTGNGEAHAWNKVKIDGDWYNVDVTWDDPVPDEKGRLRHTYLNVTDEFLKRDHSWDNTGFPSCTSTEYNYYLRTGKQCASQDEVTQYCKEQAEAGNWTVSFIYQDAILDIGDVCQSVGKGCSYTCRECEGGTWYEITFR